jgi:hypothetical protein
MDKELEDEKGLEEKPVKKKSIKKAGEDEILNKNSIEINPKLNEAPMRTAVLGWGRMNPITSGHELLVNKIKEVAKKNRATPIIYISHSQDAKKNPLSYDDKIMLAKRAFGNIIQKSNSKTIIQIMKELEDRFDKVILVAGDDRVAEFDKLLNKYNGADYNISEIEVVSAGKRADPDSDAAKDMSPANMSASVMRKLASEGDLEGFKKGLPKRLQAVAQDVYDLVRSGMKLAEMAEEDGQLTEAMTVQQRRARSLIMRKFKVKIANARRRLRKKPATMDKLKVRARKAAIRIIRKRIAGKKGEDYNNLSPSEKMLVDKRVEKKRSAIDKIAKRLLPMVRKADLLKLRSKSESFDAEFEDFLVETNVNEAFDMFLEAETKVSKYTKRYHQMYNKEGTIKLDGRFRAFRAKKEEEDSLDEGPALDAVIDKHRDERLTLQKRHRAEKADVRVREIRTAATEEFENDSDLLRFIEETANDIFNAVLLDEEKSNAGLKGKSEKSGISYGILKKVFDRGLAAYRTSHRPGTTPQQWAFARVNSFITGGKTRTTADADLWAKHSGVKESLDETMLSERHPFEVAKGVFSSIIHKKQYDHALNVLKSLLTRKKKEAGNSNSMKHSATYYAAQVARSYENVDPRTLENMLPKGYVSEEKKSGQDGYSKTLNIDEVGGAGDRGTDKLTKRYKKDTPGQTVTESIDELFEAQIVRGDEVNEDVTQKQLNDLETFADRLLNKFDVDIEFTKHFADRMNDDRNKPAITIPELELLFKKMADNQGKKIKKYGNKEAILKDMQSDLNLPIVVNWKNGEFEVVHKTIMRKKNFKSPDKVITY